MPLKVLGGGDEWGNINNAIRYAVDNGARVINMSLGGATTDQDGRLRESLQYASDRGVIVVMAAGNSSAASPGMPASHANQWGIAVGAVTSNGSLASYSNKAGTQGNMAYVTAPGSSNSTLPNNRYGGMQGTSMASPHVAGVVALMLSANPDLTSAMVRQIITSTAVTTLLPANTTSTISTLETFELEDPFVFLLRDLNAQIS
jgi:subtilisin family serine protease